MKEQKINNKRLNTKYNKGITLIALIISIIVLLILAVVSIGAVKNSKIIEHAQNTKKRYTQAELEEKVKLLAMENYLANNGKIKKEQLKKSLETEFGDDSISEDKNGNIIVTFGNGESFIISEDGTVKTGNSIETGNNTELAELEKYIFGEDLKGRDLDEIFDYNTGEYGAFISDDINTNANEDLTALPIVYEGEHEDIQIIYFKYNNQTYKFKSELYDYDNEIWKTDKSYGIQKIIVEGERVGKKVKYNNEDWTILYDDSTNGLQMISDKYFKYNNADVVLGINDTFINWTNVTDAEFDGEEGLSRLEKAVYSYNKAIENLNKACESLVEENDNIVSVRSVGSNPKDKDYENTTLYESENLSKWPTSNPGIINKKGRSTDSNYISDYDRMVALGINEITGEGDNGYFMASRRVFEKNDSVYFDIYHVYGDGSAGACIGYILNIYDADAYGESIERKRH